MFGMGTGVTPSLESPKTCLNIDGLLHNPLNAKSKFYGQAERAISNGKLNVLLRLHIRPIHLVVFQGP